MMNMDKNVLFSIIVPAYNSASFINKCIDSVLEQTYSNFELILVDDGSKDNTLDICNAYAKTDSRVKVIHKENGGHTSARNEGLKAASGLYVLFLDSDDWIAIDVLKICEKEIIKNNAPDVIIYKICSSLGKTYFTNNIPVGFYEKKANYSDIISSLIMNENGESAFIKGLIGKVFKKEIIMDNQLAIPHELRIAEDAAAFVSTIIDSSSICVNSDAKYYYYVREGSVSHSSDSDAFFRLPFMFEYYKTKIAECTYDLTKQFERYVVAQLYTAALLVMRSNSGRSAINLGLEMVLKDPMVSKALKEAKFNIKGYKYIVKKFILRHRLWGIAKLLDR